MNLLMLGVGDAGLDRADSEPVRRHLAYARRAGGHIDLVVDSTRRGVSDYGAFTVHRTGSSHILFPFTAVGMALDVAHRRSPDLITTQDPFLTAWAGLRLQRALRRPLLIQNHSSFLFNRYWLGERPGANHVLQALARFVLPRADGWRVVNTAEREIYIDRLRLPGEKVRVLPVPWNKEDFSATPASPLREETRRRWSLAPEAPVLLWAGRPARVKRIPTLFDAFASIRRNYPDARLVLAGDRSFDREGLDRQAEGRGLLPFITWTGELAPADLAALFGAADVFLFSSAYEGFGRVLVEAGWMGLPAVATATPGARDILRDGETGYLVPINEAGCLADRACSLLGDFRLRKQMGTAARQRMNDLFDPQKMFAGIVDQWQELAALNAGRR